MYGLHLFKAPQGMTFWDKLGDGPLMQGTSYQQDDVVNHVTVPTEGRKLQILIIVQHSNSLIMLFTVCPSISLFIW